MRFWGSVGLFGWLVAATGCGDNTRESAPAARLETSALTVERAPAPSASQAATTEASPPPAPEGMVLVPAGVFLMGGESEENTPVHEAVVGAFFLDKTEVTMRAFDACVAAGRCQKPSVSNPFCNALYPDRGDHPVNCVDHVNAAGYCSFAAGRLPTEAEWEYAARGGSLQQPYSWGTDEPTRHNGCFMHEGGSCKVASYPAGAFGLFDMTGNVWEWTGSRYGPYPTEPEVGDVFVYRGGSWSRRFAKWMRNDLRNRYRSQEHSAGLGFRCARDAHPLTCPADTAEKAGRCMRIRGQALCPAGEAFAEGKCRPGGRVPVFEPGQLHETPPLASARPAASSTADAKPVSVTRASAQDADCEAHYPGKPVAFRISGGSFHDREPLVRARGCIKRDVSRDWTSICCPGGG